MPEPAAATSPAPAGPLSLYHLLDPAVLADPYPLYKRLRDEDAVHWDPFLHAWVLTRYADVVTVLTHFSAARAPTTQALMARSLGGMTPVAQVMVRQMLFLDPPAHTRVRSLAAAAFTPRRVAILRSHIRDIANRLLDAVQTAGSLEVMTSLAEPLPAIVTAEMLGVSTADHVQLKKWSADFAEVLGNFQCNPDRAERTLRSLEEMVTYFRLAMREQMARQNGGLIAALATAQIDGERLTEDEVIANCIITMVGGQETTTNLIGNGLLTLLRHPDQLALVRADPALIASAVEEMLRFESPSQHTARLAPQDWEIGSKLIRKGQGVFAVMAAANRDPEHFADPDRFDIRRANNRHLAFGRAAHYCFGAPLARLEGQIVFETLLQRLPTLRLEPEPLVWRENLGLRGLRRLAVTF